MRINDFSIPGNNSNGVISKNAIIGENVELGKNVQIDPFVIVEANSIIGDNSIIRSFTRIYSNTQIGNQVEIESNCTVGTTGVAWTWNKDQTKKIVLPQLGRVVIEDNCFIGANSSIVRGSLSEATHIEKNILMAPGCRIGHGTVIGAFTHFANNIATGGNTQIGRYCFIGSGATFRPKVQIAARTIVGSGSVVIKNQIEEGMTLMGVPAKAYPTKGQPTGMPKPKNN
ncbi:MAG: DapH/DapD/GlmU-related protein [Bacteroidota bacterium]